MHWQPARDPDFWSAKRPIFLTPLRWLSQEAHYYSAYFAGRSNGEKVPGLGALASLLAICIGCNVLFGQLFGFYNWLFLIEVPKRCAMLFLA